MPTPLDVATVLAEHFPAPNMLTRQFVCDADGCDFRATADADGRYAFALHVAATIEEATAGR